MAGVSTGEGRKEFLRMEGIFKKWWGGIDFGESGTRGVGLVDEASGYRYDTSQGRKVFDRT